jgi:hypothetical protein
MKRATCAVGFCALCMAATPALATPVITSDSDCPAAAEVVARLAGLLTGNNPVVSGAAHVRVQEGTMLVELAGEGEPAAIRILPADADCHVRAQNAALVIAAWLDNLPADSLVQADSVPALAMAPNDLRTPVSANTSPTQPRFSLGAAAFASIDAQGPGAVLSVEAAWRNLAGRFGLATGLLFPLPRETSVGLGKARWWRPVLALALRAPLTQGAWSLNAAVGPIFGLLAVAGSGFDQNRTDLAVSWGATAGLRLARRSGSKWAYWAELRTLLWPAAQHIRNNVQGADPKLADLPRIEAQLGLGCSFGSL